MRIVTYGDTNHPGLKLAYFFLFLNNGASPKGLETLSLNHTTGVQK